MTTRAVLYTFRRCPYAIRVRMAIAVSGVQVDEVEVSLRAKPAEMLTLSPKGTVPVLRLADGLVLEQSLDIMRWALTQNDPEGWLRTVPDTDALIARNDGPFKAALDRYKYPQRHPDVPALTARARCEETIDDLNTRLLAQPHLGGKLPSLVDACLFPFVRQFAAVDASWFAGSPYPQTRDWLSRWSNSALFARVMAKRTDDMTSL